MAQAKKLTAADLLDPRKAPSISNWQGVISGTTYHLAAAVMKAGREGFTGLIQGVGKFAAIESDVSDEFGAPSCYMDKDDNEAGYMALRAALTVMYPNAALAKQVAEEQTKLPADERDAALMGAANAVSAQANKLINAAIGYLYQAWKNRTRPEQSPAEPMSPDAYLEQVLAKLGKMARNSKLPGADQLRAQFWVSYLRYGMQNPDEAASIVIRMAARVAGKRDQSEKKAGPVTSSKPVEAIAAAMAPETGPEELDAENIEAAAAPADAVPEGTTHQE